MEEIKRYVLNSHGSCDMCGMEQLEEWENPATDKYVSESDHKAVVETMQNKIDELEELNNSLKCCGNCDNNTGFSFTCKSCIRGLVEIEPYLDIKKNSDNWTAKGIK